MHFEYSDSAHSPAMCRCHFGQDHTAAERADGRLPFAEEEFELLGSPRAKVTPSSRWWSLRRSARNARRAS